MKDRADTTADSEVGLEFALPDAGSAAKAAIGRGLDHAAAKMKLEETDAARELLRSGDGTAWGYFEYGMAKELAEHLGAIDDHVTSVYLYDPDAGVEGEPSPAASARLAHLIVWVQRKTNALASAVAALDAALARHYGEMTGTPARASLLDVQVVDDNDVKERSGFGAMIGWLHNRPLLIWKR